MSYSEKVGTAENFYIKYAKRCILTLFEAMYWKSKIRTLTGAF